ncbi:MAG: YqjK-like family protein [Polaromonas sp.]
MDKRLAELHSERRELRHRIAVQRSSLAVQLAPLQKASSMADRAVSLLRTGMQYLRDHPVAVALAVSVLGLRKPARSWRWLQRGLFAWRSWRTLKAWLPQTFWR